VFEPDPMPADAPVVAEIPEIEAPSEPEVVAEPAVDEPVAGEPVAVDAATSEGPV
jgi:hypothetical protein